MKSLRATLKVAHSALLVISAVIWLILIRLIGIHKVRGDILVFWQNNNIKICKLYARSTIKSFEYFYIKGRRGFRVVIPITLELIIKHMGLNIFKGLYLLKREIRQEA